jgi:AraC-like DNA-binding protein
LVFVPLASLLPFAFVAVYSPASAQLASGESLAFTLVAAGMAILIYAITMLVIIAPEVTKLSASTMTPGRSAPFAEDQCQALTARVMKVMEDGAYLDPELSEASCAQRLGVHPNRLSAAVNYVTGESFRRLLNRYRLQCFVDRISDGPDADGTLLHVALDCGFPSKTTFNRVFREVYGMPPSVWIARGRTRPPA